MTDNRGPRRIQFRPTDEFGVAKTKRRQYTRKKAIEWPEGVKETILKLAVEDEKSPNDIEGTLKEQGFDYRAVQIKHKLHEWGARLYQPRRQYIRRKLIERTDKQTAFRTKKGLHTIEGSVIASSLERNYEIDIQDAVNYPSPEVDIVAYTPPENHHTPTATPIPSPAPSPLQFPGPWVYANGVFRDWDTTKSDLRLADTGPAPVFSEASIPGPSQRLYLGRRDHIVQEQNHYETFPSGTYIPCSGVDSVVEYESLRAGSLPPPVPLTATISLATALGETKIVDTTYTYTLSRSSLLSPEMGLWDTTSIRDIAREVESLRLMSSIDGSPQRIQAVLRRSDTNSLPSVLKEVLFMISNNMLAENDIDEFLSWALEKKLHSTLRSLLEIKSATIEEFAIRLLRSASRIGDLDVLKIILATGIEPEAIRTGTPRFAPPLVLAIRNQNAKVIQALLDVLVLFNSETRYVPRREIVSKEALALAVQYSEPEVITALLDAGADINAPLSNFEFEPGFALELAVERGNLEIVRLILRGGADLMSHGTAALGVAVAKGELEIVKLLLDAGAPPDVPPSGRSFRKNVGSPLVIASAKGNNAIVQLLIQFGANVNTPGLSAELWSTGSVRTALQAASGHGWVETVKILVFANADVNAPRSRGCFGETPLQAAAFMGYMEIVMFLLDNGADIHAKSGSSNYTALQAAIQSGRLDMIQALIHAGADPNQAIQSIELARPKSIVKVLQYLLQINPNIQSKHAGVLLYHVAKSGDIPFLKEILASTGANINACSEDGLSALSGALYSSIPGAEVLRYALDSGADPNLPDRSLTCLLRQFPSGGFCKRWGVERIRLLLEYGAKVNGTTLVAAIQSGCRGIMSVFLDQIDWGGMKVAKELEAGMTLEFLAMDNRYPDPFKYKIVRLLLELEADPNYYLTRYPTDSLLYPTLSPLEIAAANCGVDIVRLLLDSGARVDRPTTAGKSRLETALGAAVRVGNIGVVKLLLERGADTSVYSHYRQIRHRQVRYEGLTPLQLAARHENVEIVQVLLGSGADINAPAAINCGRTALQAAIEKGMVSTEFVEMLIAAKADVNAPAACEHGFTALQGAVMNGRMDVVELLLSAGADVNAPASKIGGRTAIEGAAEHGRLLVLHILLQFGSRLPVGFDNRNHDAEYHRSAGFAEKEGHFGIARLLRGLTSTSPPQSEENSSSPCDG